MKPVVALIRSEPAAIGGLVSALIALAVSFGLRLSVDQIGAVTALVPVVVNLVVRQAVTPTVPAAPTPVAAQPATGTPGARAPSAS